MIYLCFYVAFYLNNYDLQIMKILKFKSFVLALIGLLAISCIACVDSKVSDDSYLYFLAGSYSPATEAGVQLLAYNPGTNNIEKVSESPAGPNPSFLAWSEKRALVYAINEISQIDTIPGGSVTTLSLNKQNGKLRVVNELKISGIGPCHISIAGDIESLFISNYGGGSLSAIQLDDEGLPLAEYFSISYGDNDSPSHVHMALPILGNNKLLVSDLGLDRLIEFDLAADGKESFLKESNVINISPGSGPRHFVFDSISNHLYVVNELSSELEVFRRDQSGYHHVLKTGTLPEGVEGENYCSHIELSPDRRYLYVANRGHNSISVFELNNPGEPILKSTVKCKGDWPRHFAVSQDGQYMIIANQRSNNVTLFKIDENSGIPVYADLSYDLESPSCIVVINYKPGNE